MPISACCAAHCGANSSTAGVGLLVLLAVQALNVYKPQGMTTYGRDVVPQAASPSPTRYGVGSEPRRGVWTATPRWVRVVGVHTIGLALLFVIMHLVGGRPGNH